MRKYAAARAWHSMGMNRRTLLGAASGALAATLLPTAPAAAAQSEPLRVPPGGKITVAFIVTDGANVMDLAGPWETFQDVVLSDGSGPFQLTTVSDATQPLSMTAGLRIVPAYDFWSAPKADVVVLGAQRGHSDAMLSYIRDAHSRGAVVMSVCTGAFKLAMTGLLDGKRATTHHEFYDKFATQFPSVHLVRGERFVDDGSIITAGGLTSGISAALHVVSRYFDAPTSANVAKYMEFVPTARPA